jgi:hypothetical protein
MFARLATNAIWRSSTPARPALGPIGVEAAARRLVVHTNAFLPRRNRDDTGSTATVYCSKA